MAILSRRLTLLAILLYEYFIHYTQINLSSNMQFLSTQQHAYQSFSRFDSVCVVSTRWLNSRQNCQLEHELQCSDYDIRIHTHGVQHRMISVFNFFVVLILLLFGFVVAICDLVHAVEAMYGIR